MNEFNEGDLVEAVAADTVIRARVEQLSLGPGVNLGYLGAHYLSDFEDRAGWTLTVIEEAAPPLPTEPGLYLSAKDSDGPWIFRLDERGDWTLLNTGSPFPIGDGHLERNAPFTRLEPVPVVAKRVLDDVIAQTTMHCNACSEHLAQIAADFGATL